MAFLNEIKQGMALDKRSSGRFYSTCFIHLLRENTKLLRQIGNLSNCSEKKKSQLVGLTECFEDHRSSINEYEFAFKGKSKKRRADAALTFNGYPYLLVEVKVDDSLLSRQLEDYEHFAKKNQCPFILVTKYDVSSSAKRLIKKSDYGFWITYEQLFVILKKTDKPVATLFKEYISENHMLFTKDLSQKRLNFLASRLFWPNTGSGKQTSKDNLIGLAKTFDFFTTNLQIVSSRLVSHKGNKRQTIDVAIQPNVFINTYVAGEVSLNLLANSKKTKGTLSKTVEFNDQSLQFMPSYRTHIEWVSKKKSGLQAHYACGKDGGHIFFFSQMKLTDNEKAPWVYLEYGYRVECSRPGKPIIGLYASVRVDNDENVPDIVKLNSRNCSEQKTCEVLHELISKAIRSASKKSPTVKKYLKKVELKRLTLS